jgi:benzoate-CoA ligase family protein
MAFRRFTKIHQWIRFHFAGVTIMTRQFKDYSDILHHHAVRRGGHTALYNESNRISYALLEENVNRCGNMLKSLGLKAGERIVLALPDCPDTFYAFLGAMKCGIKPVLLNPDMPQSSYEYILRDAEPSALITIRSSAAVKAGRGSLLITLCINDERYAELLKQSSTSLRPSPPAEDGVDFLLYSSGSTGEPKGVPHSQDDMLFCAEQYAGKILKMSQDDIVLSASKLHFAYGLGNSLIFPLYFGASVILNSLNAGPADIFHIFELIAKLRPSLFFAVPTLYSMMTKTMDENVSFPSIRLCVSAGEALPAGVYREWKRLTGLEVIDGIGSTEALHIFISNRPGNAIPGKTGFVVPGYEAGIIGEDGCRLPSGRPGTLLIRGKSMAPFYWNRPDMTVKTMLDDGWLNTGDVFIEENGCFTYQGRLDDMFKSSGVWVSPLKVENVLRDHPAVLECVVTSCPKEGLLKPLAYIVLKSGYEKETGLSRKMRSFVLERLPAYMCPVQFIFTDNIPKTGTGKIQRSVLRLQTPVDK